MKLFINKQIGKNKYTFQVEGNNLEELIQETKKLSFGDVDKCGICNSTDIHLDYHLAKNKYKYTFIRCMNCRSTNNFGRQMENPDIFYLKKEWKEPLNNLINED